MSDEHGPKHYVKIWAILLVLLMVSIVGPMFEIQAVTLITAFGIAIVKALIVARNFMHLPLERKYVTYIVSTCLIFMFLFWAAVAPDVMKSTGTNWEKPAWIEQEAAYARGEIGEAHGDPAGDAGHDAPAH